MNAHQIEFFQCLKYILFRFQLKHRLNDLNYLMNDSWEDNYYLISHDWIEKWRNYVGFGYINIYVFIYLFFLFFSISLIKEFL